MALSMKSSWEREKCHTSLISVQMMGGLGNQLFQFAAAVALSIERSMHFKLVAQRSGRPYAMNLFNIKSNQTYRALVINDRLVIEEVAGCHCKKLIAYQEPSFRYSRIVFEESHIILKGYFQSWKYFQDIQEPLRVWIRRHLSSQGQDDEILCKHVAGAVVIQIRLGDMARNETTRRFHGVVTAKYIEQALTKFSCRGRKLIVITDDIEYVSVEHPQLLGLSNVHFSNAKMIDDFKMLTLANQVVISNSTFGWWGAWIGEAEVISPEEWFAHGNSLNDQLQDLFPENWIRL